MRGRKLNTREKAMERQKEAHILHRSRLKRFRRNVSHLNDFCVCVCVCVCVLGGCKEDEKREKGGRQIKYYPSICLLWCRHGVLRRWWRANMFSSFIPPNTALQGQREPVSGCCVSVRLGCWGLVCLARCLSLSVSMETSLSEPMCLS
jgi:hypothetical protein